MGTERINIGFDVAGNTYQISGAKWFYDDKEVKGLLGGQTVGEKTTGATKKGAVITHPESVKRILIKLVAVYVLGASGSAGAAGTVKQSKIGRFTFYCDPDKAEDMITNLPGKNVSSREILRVYRPLRRAYR